MMTYYLSCLRACTYLLHAPRVRQDGWTAMMNTACHGHTEIARLLLDHGADVNLANGVSAAFV